jgi:hypothetical protein
MHFIIILAAALSIMCTPVALKAQITVNINTQPPWGPTGYDYVEYYYLPDIEVYYNVPLKRYYYYDGNKWTYTSNLPSRYNYNYYRSYKVVINEKEPWTKHKNHKNKYASYKNRSDQSAIRDSKDAKYFGNKNHPQYNKQNNNSSKNKNSNSDKGKGKSRK